MPKVFQILEQKNNLNMNIKPALRLESVEEYYFSTKLKEIAKMNAEGKDVINLGIGSPDLPPSASVINSLCEDAKDATAHSYQSYVGIPKLRKAFADWYRKYYDVNLNPDNEVIPLMGSKEGIMHISMAFLNEGDGVLVPDPGYPTYTSVSKLVGAKIHTYSLKEENNWYPDFEAIEKANQDGLISLDQIKLMWCNYPNMPTGADANDEIFKKLILFGKKHNIIICHDNPYSFVLNSKPCSILSIDGAKDICIELNSLSKSSNMAGWRVGALASNAQFIDWVLRVKTNMDSGMFRPIQVAAIDALNASEDWYGDINKIYGKRRSLALEIMEQIGAEVRPDQVGMFLWLG